MTHSREELEAFIEATRDIRNTARAIAGALGDRRSRRAAMSNGKVMASIVEFMAAASAHADGAEAIARDLLARYPETTTDILLGNDDESMLG